MKTKNKQCPTQKSPAKKVGRVPKAKSQYFDYQIGDGDMKNEKEITVRKKTKETRNFCPCIMRMNRLKIFEK